MHALIDAEVVRMVLTPVSLACLLPHELRERQLLPSELSGL